MTAAEEIAKDESRNWAERIRATAEVIYQGKRENEMQCKVPGCKLKATHTFAKAPVCECHRYDLQQEAEEAYEDRVLFESIRKHTIWKKVEPGDEKKVIVAEVKNGEITALRLKNDKFTINRRYAYKGVKVL